MNVKVQVAIVGSGPAGLSAGAHAAELGLSHMVLEASSAHANTIQEYQKGKEVMAEPGYLPLRSLVPFKQSSREEVLREWYESLLKYQVEIRYNAEVVEIKKGTGGFSLKLHNGDLIESEFVVLSIGVAGNPRKLEGPGSDLPFIQYTLKDPDEFSGETIIVIGAGDAAIENALALAKRNRVCIINRTNEFARAKQGNLEAILKAIEERRITCYYKSSVARIEENSEGEKRCLLVLNTEQKEIKIPCDRIIARLGAIAPRKFVESCGIKFPGADPGALPDLSSQYESTVPGLYVIGALGGYPLIKQALNQGYEVIEYILGHDIKPADNDLLVQRLSMLPYRLSVEECLDLLRQRIPLFSQINPLLFREMMLESSIRVLEAGQTVFKKDDFSTSVYTILDGEIEMDYEDGITFPYRVGSGGIFGELSLISGRQRTSTATARAYSLLVEIPRRTLLKLAASIDSVREGLDQQFIARTIQNALTPSLDIEALRDIAGLSRLERHRVGDMVFREGDIGDDIYLVRRGAVALSRSVEGRDVLVRQVRAGQYFGQVSLMNVGRRIESACAVVASETIRLSRDSFIQLLEKDETLLRRFQDELSTQAEEETAIASSPIASDALGFLLKNGAGEATDLLVINDSLCVGCDNCETACAETHGGITRVNRKEGPAFATIHIAVACRHCENPSCMKECPPDAIKLERGGQVNINYDTCIGCGKCESNCPYEVIRMAVEKKKRTHLFTWMLTGFGFPPGELGGIKKGAGSKKAVKCDLCKDRPSGPACVIACPTGAARRVKVADFNRLAQEAES